MDTSTGPNEKLVSAETRSAAEAGASGSPRARRRVVLTGGAGFLGSHLCNALLSRGDEVVCVDDLSTGSRENVAALFGLPCFSFQQTDVTDRFWVDGSVDIVVHLASPASPPDYQRRPLETLAAGSRGTENALRLAREHDARFVLASTSEVYGDPVLHPQREEYWGNVNPVGPRSVYDEAKRYAEAVTTAYARVKDLDVGILRIFNTFGPRMRPKDGRVVSNFITQALNGDPLSIHGDGKQTRSFCYVDDMTRGIIAMLDSHELGPINLGNPDEQSVTGLAEMVIRLTGSTSRLEFHPLPIDDPARRRPDITRAHTRLGWYPVVDTAEGLARTIEWIRSRPRTAGDGSCHAHRPS